MQAEMHRYRFPTAGMDFELSSPLTPRLFPPLPDLPPIFTDNQESTDENDPYTQQQSEMSTTGDSPRLASPLAFQPTPEEQEQARAWLCELGLDSGCLKEMVEKLHQARNGLLGTQARTKGELADIEANMCQWQQARNSIDLEFTAARPCTKELDGLEAAKNGLDQAISSASQRSRDWQAALNVLNAKISVVQDLFFMFEEAHPTPFCPICAVNPADRAAQPCGHMYCNSCAKKMMRQVVPGSSRNSNSSKPCYICRRVCKGFMQIHFC